MTPLEFFGILFLAALASGAPQCAVDKKYADERSCTKFYECFDGMLEEGECPLGTFFDQSRLHCRPSIEADCDFTAEKARLLLGGKTPKVYLGFDDGPGHGTRDVLRALNNNNVKATFFINGISMSKGLGVAYAAFNRKTLFEAVSSGHELGDHSLNHMKHNNKDADGTNAYKNLKKDLGAFGFAHSGFVKSELIDSGLDQRSAAKITQRMEELVRMPYTNAWRVRMSDGRKPISINCPGCTTPESSGRISTEIADELHNGRYKANIFGWDIEWNMEFIRETVGMTEEKAAQIMLANLGIGHHTADEGKIVVLAHDRDFGAPLRGSNLDLSGALDKFLKLAKKAGFVFRKLSDYPEDY